MTFDRGGSRDGGVVRADPDAMAGGVIHAALAPSTAL
jgi:hypothetical protein